MSVNADLLEDQGHPDRYSDGYREDTDKPMAELTLRPLVALNSRDLAKMLSALVEAQKGFKPVKRSQRADTGSYSYDYASLKDINDAVDKALADQGLKVFYRPYFSGHRYILRAYLVHVSGQYIDCEYLLDPDQSGGKAKHQDRGSAMTYGMKYTKSCLLGLAPEDDDGRRADKRPDAGSKQQEPQQPRGSQKPKQRVRCQAEKDAWRYVGRLKIDRDKFKQVWHDHFKKSLKELKPEEWRQICARLQGLEAAIANVADALSTTFDWFVLFVAEESLKTKDLIEALDDPAKFNELSDKYTKWCMQREMEQSPETPEGPGESDSEASDVKKITNEQREKIGHLVSLSDWKNMGNRKFIQWRTELLGYGGSIRDVTYEDAEKLILAVAELNAVSVLETPIAEQEAGQEVSEPVGVGAEVDDEPPF